MCNLSSYFTNHFLQLITLINFFRTYFCARIYYLKVYDDNKKELLDSLKHVSTRYNPMFDKCT